MGGTIANEFDDLPASGDVLYLLSLVVFAWAVDDGVACSDGPSQGTAYAQTIPFQGLIVACQGGC